MNLIQQDAPAYQKILSLFAREVREKIERVADGYLRFYEKLSEIRLRANRYMSLTVEGKNLPIPYIYTAADLSQLLRKCCENSVYAYAESLREGYVTYQGSRVGVAGRAVMEEGVIVGVDHVSSLVFRIPHLVLGAGDVAADVFRRLGGREGVLIYSAPGVGKTTLLRDLAFQLSTGKNAIRVALVDCRGELSSLDFGEKAMIDVLRDYPKAEGIEIATRTLSPEVVICDEIGGYDEAESILAVQNCGVPLIASAHASSYEELIKRAPVRLLLECGVFGAFVGVVQENGTYTYHVDYRKERSQTLLHRKDSLCC